MTTPKERMREARLHEIRTMCGNYHPRHGALVGMDFAIELLAEIDALRAELTAARTVEDGEVLRHVKWLLTGCVDWDGSRMVDGEIPKGEIKCGDFRQIADLLTRLSAAKAEAERERDEARLLAEQLEANILREEKAHERTIFQRDEAEECVSDIYFATMGEAPEWSNNFGFKDALADIKGAHKLLGDALRAAQSALAQARADALEEAARACIDTQREFEGREDIALMSDMVAAIRALKSLTPTQESETP